MPQRLTELDEPLDDLQAQTDRAADLETELDRLERKLTEMNALRDEHQELVEYVNPQGFV